MDFNQLLKLHKLFVWYIDGKSSENDYLKLIPQNI